MKDYDHVVLWLDYFNKHLSKRKGRRIKRDGAVFDPTVSELGYDPTTENTNDKARHPRRSFVKSGYIMLPKSEGKRKSVIISNIAEKMLQKRNKQKFGQR